MLMLGYSLLLVTALVLSTPWWLYRMVTASRYREGLSERLGRVPARLRNAIAGKQVIWIHSVSVGEVLAASSLIATMDAELGATTTVVVSTTTKTGQELARKRFGADRVFYFPLDFGFAVRRWLRVLQPSLVLLTESELWPRMMHECEEAGIPVAVVNARVSDRSFRRSMRFRSLWQRMARHTALWLPQSQGDAARLVQLGVQPGRVQVEGNLKFDTEAPAESALAAAIRNSVAGRPVVVAGSTVAYGTTPEEGIVLDAMRAHVWPEFPHVALLLAPRHPQRFTEAKVLAAQYGTTLCATELLHGVHDARVHERIIVLDTIGDLATLYRIADLAFVGGSLLPHGGHNPLEPAQFGVPVIVGPHMENFRDIAARMLDAEGLIALKTTEPEALGRAVSGLLEDRTRAEAIGERGRAVYQEQKGATERTFAALLPLLHAGRGTAAR